MTPRPGDRVYVRGWRQDVRLLVKRLSRRRTRLGFPHWICTDAAGYSWVIPQIHMSSRPMDG